MKQFLVALVAAVAVCGMQSNAEAVFVKFLVDDFTDPALPTHTSSPGLARSLGGAGGTIVPISMGTDIALDRGLTGRAPGTTGPFDPGALVAGSGDLDFALAPGEAAEFEWDVSGFDFVAMEAPVIVLAGLTNTGASAVSLVMGLFQDGVIVTSDPFTLAPGETRDVSLVVPSLGPTSFLGLGIFNDGGTTFFGVADQVVANPEPATMALIGLGVMGGAFGYRRRRKEDEVVPATVA